MALERLLPKRKRTVDVHPDIITVRPTAPDEIQLLTHGSCEEIEIFSSSPEDAVRNLRLREYYATGRMFGYMLGSLSSGSYAVYQGMSGLEGDFRKLAVIGVSALSAKALFKLGLKAKDEANLLDNKKIEMIEFRDDPYPYTISKEKIEEVTGVYDENKDAFEKKATTKIAQNVYLSQIVAFHRPYINNTSQSFRSGLVLAYEILASENEDVTLRQEDTLQHESEMRTRLQSADYSYAVVRDELIENMRQHESMMYREIKKQFKKRSPEAQKEALLGAAIIYYSLNIMLRSRNEENWPELFSGLPEGRTVDIAFKDHENSDKVRERLEEFRKQNPQ